MGQNVAEGLQTITQGLSGLARGFQINQLGKKLGLGDSFFDEDSFRLALQAKQIEQQSKSQGLRDELSQARLDRLVGRGGKAGKVTQTTKPTNDLTKITESVNKAAARKGLKDIQKDKTFFPIPAQTKADPSNLLSTILQGSTPAAAPLTPSVGSGTAIPAVRFVTDPKTGKLIRQGG